MSIRLITGKAGEPHITSADIGKFNSLIFGEGKYVFDVGGKLTATKVSDTSISIDDGEGIINGRHFRVEGSEPVDIMRGDSKYNRTDLIVVRYVKDTVLGQEFIGLWAIKGVATTSADAPVPEYNAGSILDGEIIVDMPLYKVKIAGTTISSISRMFEIKTPIDRDMEAIRNDTNDNSSRIELLTERTSILGSAVNDHENALTNIDDHMYEFRYELNNNTQEHMRLDELLDDVFIIERREVNFSFDAGTIGTRAYSASDSIGISGYTPVAVTVGSISNTSRFIPTVRLNGTSSVSVNAYRATASASGSNEFIYYYVAYVKNELRRVVEVEN